MAIGLLLIVILLIVAVVGGMLAVYLLNRDKEG